MISTDELRRLAELETVVRIPDVDAQEIADELDELREIARRYHRQQMASAHCWDDSNGA